MGIDRLAERPVPSEMITDIDILPSGYPGTGTGGASIRSSGAAGTGSTATLFLMSCRRPSPFVLCSGNSLHWLRIYSKPTISSRKENQNDCSRVSKPRKQPSDDAAKSPVHNYEQCFPLWKTCNLGLTLKDNFRYICFTSFRTVN